METTMHTTAPSTAAQPANAAAPPTAASPTAASPTAASPTAASPTAVSPTAVSPTAVSPTAVSPTAVSLSVVETCFKACTVLSSIALTLTIAAAGGGQTVNTFMWVRGILLLVIAVLLYRTTLAAARGSRRAFDRVRTLSLITPIAIIAVDLIPGVCPLWYAALQTLCMIPVIVAAVATRRPAFPR
jgi:hypothetical protein